MLEWLLGKKAKLPNKEWFEAIREFVKFTPDTGALEQKMFHRVFVPDNMMEKRPHNDQLGEGSYKLTNVVTKDKFTFWNVRGGPEGSWAVALDGFGNRAPTARIKGELHLVPTEALLQLDKRYQNGVMFNRIKVRVLIPFTPATDLQLYERDLYWRAAEKTVFLDKTVSAWMYVGVLDFWSDLLERGTKIKFTDSLGQTSFSTVSNTGHVLSPVRSFNNSRLGLYYYYTPHEFIANSNK